jgi:MFS family permease
MPASCPGSKRAIAQADRMGPVSAPNWRFYGWRIVGVAFLVDFIAVGFFFYSYGVFFKAIAADLGSGTRFGVSLGLSISNVVGAAVSPFIGRALDRVPIKRIMIAGAVCVAVGFGLLSQISAFWQYYLVLGTLLGVGGSLMGGLASSKLVANWFVARRGTAFGIATVGISLSGLMMPTAATWLIATVGWRGGFGVYGLCTLAVVVRDSWWTVPRRWGCGRTATDLGPRRPRPATPRRPCGGPATS